LGVELIDEGEEEDDQLVDFVLLHLAVTQAGDALRTHLEKCDLDLTLEKQLKESKVY